MRTEDEVATMLGMLMRRPTPRNAPDTEEGEEEEEAAKVFISFMRGMKRRRGGGEEGTVGSSVVKVRLK